MELVLSDDNDSIIIYYEDPIKQTKHEFLVDNFHNHVFTVMDVSDDETYNTEIGRISSKKKQSLYSQAIDLVLEYVSQKDKGKSCYVNGGVW